MRTRGLALSIAILSLACASTKPLEMGTVRSGTCEESCRAQSRSCDDDAHQPDEETCAEQLHACLTRCGDLREPLPRHNVAFMSSVELFFVSFLSLLFGTPR